MRAWIGMFATEFGGGVSAFGFLFQGPHVKSFVGPSLSQGMLTI